MFELDLGDLAEKVGLRFSTSRWSQKKVLEVNRSTRTCLRTLCLYESNLSTFISVLFGLKASLRSQLTYWYTQLTLYLCFSIWIFTVQLAAKPNRRAGISRGTPRLRIYSHSPLLALWFAICCFAAFCVVLRHPLVSLFRWFVTRSPIKR